jgi:hypothetical protein
MRTLGRLTLSIKGYTKADKPESIAIGWQKLFPGTSKDFPITQIDNKTAYAEIHVNCPLRGTGDAKACYHLMEYDRFMVKKIGGEFVVLESQAVTGKTFCRVAIRKKGDSTEDLVPAYSP